MLGSLCRSCVKLGYFTDEFVQHFVRRGATKRSPLINRGFALACPSNLLIIAARDHCLFDVASFARTEIA